MNKLNILLQLAAITATTTIVSAYPILYLENFNNLEEFVRPAAVVGWQGFWDQGSPGPVFDLAELADPEGVRRDSPLGNPDGVNNKPVEGAEVGLVFWSPTRRTNVTIATQEFAGVMHSSDIAGFLWDYSIDAPSSNDGQLIMRALIQIGGSPDDTDNWYVTDPMLSLDTVTLAADGPTNGFYVGRWQRAAVSAVSNWIRVPHYDYANKSMTWPRSGSPKTQSDFAGYEGYTFYRGPLPAGVVHGFGILMDNRWGGNFWMDNYTILGHLPQPEAPSVNIALQQDNLVLQVPSSQYYHYQLLKSTDNLDSFAEVSYWSRGESGLVQFWDSSETVNEGRVFYRIGVTKQFPHPNALHSSHEIDTTRYSIAQAQPDVVAAHTALGTQATEFLQRTPQPPTIFNVPSVQVDNDGHMQAVRQLSGDSWAAYALALHYQLDPTVAGIPYGAKAIEILNVWASVNQGTSGADGDLVMAYAGVGMLYAAELMRSSSLWSDPEIKQFESWVRNVFLGSCYLIQGRQNNWGDWGLLGAVASHYFLGETFALEADITQLRNRIERNIAPNGVMQREVSRGWAGMWYTYFSLAPMTAAAQVLNNAQLVDFFNYEPSGGGGIRQALDYLFFYCLDPDAWPHFEGDLLHRPAPEVPFYSSLFEAMAGVYGDADYAAWVESARPIMNYDHHFAWTVPTLMKALP